MKKMVENNKMVVSGENGEELLKFFSETIALVNQPNND